MRVFQLVLVVWSFLAESVLKTDDVASYISFEEPIAQAGLLANIGSDGLRAHGAAPGVVIASPTTQDPDYFYTWVRDSSLVFKLIIDLYAQGHDGHLRGLIDDFVAAETKLQQVPNRSGDVSTGGLGEPKFEVNETAFTGDWGRPQRDGPALRATAFITYAKYLLKQNETSYVTDKIWPAVKLDLDYVANSWNLTGFDLWEELRVASFFTTAAQHRALREGAAFAKALGHDAGTYTEQADNVFCFLQSYWNPAGAYMTANVGPSSSGRSGLDSNTVLASIHNFDPAAGCDGATFQPCSDRALANLLAYVRSFADVYPINADKPANASIAVGRYPEDRYGGGAPVPDGGNPWYLSVFGVAEQLYDALHVWGEQGALTVTELSRPFFALFLPEVQPGYYKSSSRTYKALARGVAAYADGFLLVNARYTPKNGSLAEQFNRTSGKPQSARHLTWSYASALTAFYARDASLAPASWGAKGLKVPSVCKRGPPQPEVAVTFNVRATTIPGEHIHIVGSTDELKNWSPSDAPALDPSHYPVWSLNVNLAGNTNIEYKYIRKTDWGTVVWESDPNNVINTPGGGEWVQNDVWR